MSGEGSGFGDYVRAFSHDPPLLPPPRAIEPGERPSERVSFERGLTDDEIAATERRFRFTFPPDLRSLLAEALPVTPGFPDWRSGAEEDLERMLEWPADGICFDVERSGFWLAAWGARPLDPASAIALAREQIATAPTLIPIYGRRYIADEPSEAGNPVFSVHQSDIVLYADNLYDFLERDFRGRENPQPSAGEPRKIRFWSELAL